MKTFTELATRPCCSHIHNQAQTCGEQANGQQLPVGSYQPETYHSRRLALMLSAFFVLPVAGFMPLVTVGLQGSSHPVTLGAMVLSMTQHHQWLLAMVVLLIFMLFPALQIGCFCWLTHFARHNRRAPGHRIILQVTQWITPWCMSDVCLLGLLIAGYKMFEFVQLSTGPGFWALIPIALLSRSITRHDLAKLWSVAPHPTCHQRQEASKSSPKLVGCHHCGLISHPDTRSKFVSRCPRCHTVLSLNPVGSLSRTAALLLAAFFCYFPANLLPVMQTTFLGNSSEKTIISGIVAFWNSGAYAIAAIIFIASMLIPLLKFMALGFLIITCHLRSKWAASRRHQLYRLTEAIGYLSLLDVIVVVIMACAMQFAPSVTVIPRSGITFFALSVILTMLSALSFDPRLIWSRDNNE